MEEERKLILDTETTGLNFDDDRIIEIGIVELKNNMLTQNYFHEYINPEREITLSAQKIHGISIEFLKDKPIFSEIVQKFLDFIKNDTIIIHNADFDINFINKELSNCGLNRIQNSIIDTVKLAKKEFPGQAVNLDSLCRKLSVTNIRQDYHGALLDATLLSKVYLRLTTGKQEDLDLIDSKSIKLCNEGDNIKNNNTFFSPRRLLMKLTDDEKKEHEKFIEEMKDPIWKKVK